MNIEKWQEIKGQIKDDFGIEEESKEPLQEGPGEIEIVIFKGPLGRVKLEYTLKPMVEEKKVHSSKRIGSEVTEEFVYSDTEKVGKLKAYKWHEEGENWVEIEAEKLSL